MFVVVHTQCFRHRRSSVDRRWNESDNSDSYTFRVRRDLKAYPVLLFHLQTRIDLVPPARPQWDFLPRSLSLPPFSSLKGSTSHPQCHYVCCCVHYAFLLTRILSLGSQQVWLPHCFIFLLKCVPVKEAFRHLYPERLYNHPSTSVPQLPFPDWIFFIALSTLMLSWLFVYWLHPS